MKSIAFIGAGAMGSALVRGLLQAKVLQPDCVVAFDVDSAKAEVLAQQHGIRVANTATQAATDAEVVLLAVKPDAVRPALEPLAKTLNPQQTVISIAAGVACASVEEGLHQPVPVVRAMPNAPAVVGCGATAIACGTFARSEHMHQARELFEPLGVVVEVPEKQLDAVTGLSGSGPAFAFIFMEALADGGVKMGLTREVALQLAAQTVCGAARMILELKQHPAALKDMVASPGGTTIAGLHCLEQEGFRGAVMDAVEAAATRSRDLRVK